MSDLKLWGGIALSITFFVGYYYGGKQATKKRKSQIEKDSRSESDGLVFSNTGNYKMILVVRNDLKMGKGKIAAQCSHGAVGAVETALKKYPTLVKCWRQSGCAKIAVKVESEEELISIRNVAHARNLNTCLIRDAGRTQIEPNTKTVLAIGPAAVQEIDKVTGHLKLL